MPITFTSITRRHSSALVVASGAEHRVERGHLHQRVDAAEALLRERDEAVARGVSR